MADAQPTHPESCRIQISAAASDREPLAAAQDQDRGDRFVVDRGLGESCRSRTGSNSALRTRFSGRAIDVVNRGTGGQESPEELSRFESDMLAEAPALVIWQIGTNAVFHNATIIFHKW